MPLVQVVDGVRRNRTVEFCGSLWQINPIPDWHFRALESFELLFPMGPLRAIPPIPAAPADVVVSSGSIGTGQQGGRNERSAQEHCHASPRWAGFRATPRRATRPGFGP